MSLGPDSWCLPGDLPRHKLRAYGRLAGVPGGAEYRRLLNFLSKNAAQGEREILDITSVPQFAQVPSIVNRRIREASESSFAFGNRLMKTYSQADPNSSGRWTINQQQPICTAPQPIQEMISEAVPQPLDELREPPRFEPPITPAPFARLSDALKTKSGPAELLDFAPYSDVELTSISFEPMCSQYVEEAMQTDFAVTINDHDFSVGDDTSSVNEFLSSLMSSEPAVRPEFTITLNQETTNPFSVNQFLNSLGSASDAACQPALLNPDVPANIVEKVVAEAKIQDNEFVSHLSVLLNEWFDKENTESAEDLKPVPRGLETPEQRRERVYALLKKPVEKLESKRLMQKLGDATLFETTAEPRSRRDAGASSGRAANQPGSSSGQNVRSWERQLPAGIEEKKGFLDAARMAALPGSDPGADRFADPSLDVSSQDSRAVPGAGCSGKPARSAGVARSGGTSRGATPEARRRARKREAHETTRHVSFLPDGMRKEEAGDGSFVLKDAVGRVVEARSHDGVIMSFSYDNRGHLKSFVRSDVSGKIHTTGVKDKHGVIVRDEHGAVRAQGDSMTVDTNGCVSIRKFDGQFWSLDVQRGIHIERRILEDGNGNWNCLTALLTCDGFRMVTRFQKLQENKRESYRKYGDWLGSTECSKFRFYGRDGSMIEFESDEDLQALRPSRIWSAGTRSVDREWVGRRQAGTAWDAVHRYISQYLSAL